MGRAYIIMCNARPYIAGTSGQFELVMRGIRLGLHILKTFELGSIRPMTSAEFEFLFISIYICLLL